MSFLDANGTRIHYQRSGPDDDRGAPVVVFVHGLAVDNLASLYLWMAAPAAAEGFDAVFYDLRGHGRSGRPETGYALTDFTTDLHALLDGLDIERPVHLVGSSFGGTIAFEYAARHPEHVASVVSIDSGPATERWATLTRYALQQLVDSAVERLAVETPQEMYAGIAAAEGLHTAKKFKSAYKVLTSAPILEEMFAGPFLPVERIATIDCPVLSIVGSSGVHQDDPRGLERLLPDCTTEIVSGGGHYLLTEQPHAIRDTVLGWVADRETAEARAA